MINNRKSILFIPSWYPDSSRLGHGIFIKKHAEIISEYCDVTVINFIVDRVSRPEKKDYDIEKLNPNLTVLHFYIPSRKLKVGNLISILKAQYLFKKNVINNKIIKYDLVHLNVVYHIGVLLYFFLIKSKMPLIITEHWTGYFNEDGAYRRLNFLIKFCIRNLMKRAVSVIVISESLKLKLDTIFSISFKTVVIPNVLNCSFDISMLKEEPPNEEFRFLVIANFDDRQKGITEILNAFSKILIIYPNSKLILAGDGADFNKIKTHAQNLIANSNCITFLGSISNSEVFLLYQQADCYVMNSNFETFSISTAEALLHGLPVIATRCNGPEEYVNERNGVLIEKQNPSQLKNAMLFMIKNRKLYNRLEIIQEMRGRYCRNIGLDFMRVYDAATNGPKA